MVKPSIIGDNSAWPEEEPDITVDHGDDLEMRLSRLTVAGERDTMDLGISRDEIGLTAMPYLTS